LKETLIESCQKLKEFIKYLKKSAKTFLEFYPTIYPKTCTLKLLQTEKHSKMIYKVSNHGQLIDYIPVVVVVVVVARILLLSCC
jgi:hypothetical protein